MCCPPADPVYSCFVAPGAPRPPPPRWLLHRCLHAPSVQRMATIVASCCWCSSCWYCSSSSWRVQKATFEILHLSPAPSLTRNRNREKASSETRCPTRHARGSRTLQHSSKAEPRHQTAQNLQRRSRQPERADYAPQPPTVHRRTSRSMDQRETPKASKLRQKRVQQHEETNESAAARRAKRACHKKQEWRPRCCEWQ